MTLKESQNPLLYPSIQTIKLFLWKKSQPYLKTIGAVLHFISIVKMISKGIEEGCGTDAPGSFASWLSTKVPVFAMEMPRNRYDVGTLESYNEINSKYTGISL